MAYLPLRRVNTDESEKINNTIGWYGMVMTTGTIENAEKEEWNGKESEK